MPKRKTKESEDELQKDLEKKAKIEEDDSEIPKADSQNGDKEKASLKNQKSESTAPDVSAAAFKKKIKILSWNVNGARAVVKKPDSLKFLQEKSKDPEVLAFCLQETKCDGKTFPKELDTQVLKSPAAAVPEASVKKASKKASKNSAADAGNEGLTAFKKHYLNSSSAKKGYSGTCIYSKFKPISNKFGMGFQPADIEGRVITVEYEKFFLVTAYVPNSSDGLKRLDERTKKFEPKMRKFLADLDDKKPVIYCGDLNVACSEIELKNAKSNYNKSAGYTQAEIDQFFKMIKDNKFVDVFRHFYPDKSGCYTYWSYRFNARAKNTGWRLDYFLVSERLVGNVEKIIHHTDVLGSDHCPIELVLEI